MLLFRSEEHLEHWLSSDDRPRGARMTIEQQWTLAQTWFAGRDTPEWRKRSAEEAQSLFAQAGLTGELWRLT